MTTWVLLRGLGRESGHWGDFPALLRERLGDAAVAALDLPGSGRLHRDASPTRVEAMTRCYRDELRRLGLAPPYRLLALSMGAMVAIDWARAAPGEVAGCVLINTSLRGVDPWYWRLRPANYPALLGLARPGRSAAAHEGALLRLTSRNPERAARALDAWARIRRERPVARRNLLRQLLAAARFMPSTDAPAVPLLVLASANDGLVDVRCSTRLAQRWHAEIALHRQAGHDLPLDDGPWVVETVARWAERPHARAAPTESARPQ